MGLRCWFGGDLERLSSGKHEGRNPEFWAAKVCRGRDFLCRGKGLAVWCVPRHKVVVPRHKAIFRVLILGNFRPLLRGFGGRLRGVVLRF